MHSNVVLMVVIAVLVLALLAGLVVGARRTRVEFTPPGEDQVPAQRNQALIDAPPAAVTAPMGDAGVVVPPVPVPVTASETAAAMPQEGDDLTRLKGVGPKLADQLRALGVRRFSQVADWSEADIDRIDAQLGRFQGRIRRDEWTTQARLLAAGDTVGYEARFGKL